MIPFETVSIFFEHSLQLMCAFSVSVLFLQTIFTYFFSAYFGYIFPVVFLRGPLQNTQYKGHKYQAANNFPRFLHFQLSRALCCDCLHVPIFPPPSSWACCPQKHQSVLPIFLPLAVRLNQVCCKDLVMYYCPQGALACSSISIISRPDQASFLSVHSYLAIRVPRNLGVFFAPETICQWRFFFHPRFIPHYMCTLLLLILI